MIKRILMVLIVPITMSGCVLFTASQTKRTPTPAELQAQLQADVAGLQALGCAINAAGKAAAPIITATVDEDGQRVAAAIDDVSGVVCMAKVPNILPTTVATP